MKIAFDITPLTNGHKYRGTGFYTLHLKNTFEKYFSQEHKFVFFTNRKSIPKDVDVVHYPYFDPFSFSIPAFPKTKTVITILDLIPIIFPKAFPSGFKGNLKWKVQKFAVQHSNGIITDSHAAKKDIERLTGIDSKKVHVTYLAAGEEFQRIENQERIKELKRKYGLPEKFALYVGDVTWNKNLPRLVEAAIHANVSLVMVGKALVNKNFDQHSVWNADLVKIQDLAKGNKNILFPGFVSNEDLVLLYNAATVFVMPSIYEGFGLPILEAMSCGCPVITSKEGSISEVAGDAAYYVDAYSTNDITRGIEKVFSDSTLRKNLTQTGFQQVVKFSWKKTAKETLDAYHLA